MTHPFRAAPSMAYGHHGSPPSLSSHGHLSQSTHRWPDANQAPLTTFVSIAMVITHSPLLRIRPLLTRGKPLTDGLTREPKRRPKASAQGNGIDSKNCPYSNPRSCVCRWPPGLVLASVSRSHSKAMDPLERPWVSEMYLGDVHSAAPSKLAEVVYACLI